MLWVGLICALIGVVLWVCGAFDQLEQGLDEQYQHPGGEDFT